MRVYQERCVKQIYGTIPAEYQLDCEGGEEYDDINDLISLMEEGVGDLTRVALPINRGNFTGIIEEVFAYITGGRTCYTSIVSFEERRG